MRLYFEWTYVYIFLWDFEPAIFDKHFFQFVCCHSNLPQSYKLICYEPALRALEEVIEALLLELAGIPGTRYGSAEPDVLFEVFVG